MKQWKKVKRIFKRLTRTYRRQLPMAGIILGFIFIFAVGGTAIRGTKETDVYAAAGTEDYTQSISTYAVSTGISGVITGVMETRPPQDMVERIGTSCEEVIVGQRKRKIESVGTLNAAWAAQQTVSSMNQCSSEMSTQSAIMSDNDYATLLSIVEAESGGEDLEGRIMVANVILNRVESDRFPDNVYDVVWEVVGGMAQFSPTEDGRISSVTISETTEEAVKKALEGTDLSQGALFFVAKDQANKDNVKWFESDLKPLFEHGVHSFYTYPDL